jgi:hypothetical protein
MVQRYLPEVRQGDKRVILVDGEPVGAVNRVPSAGEARSNLHVGGTAEATELTARDREICAIIGPELRRRGLLFVGIDVIGDYLTEINVTSPTGIREIQRLTGTDIAAMTWDAIEHRKSGHASNGCCCKSAIVRATLNTRWNPRADSDFFSIASSRRDVASGLTSRSGTLEFSPESPAAVARRTAKSCAPATRRATSRLASPGVRSSSSWPLTSGTSMTMSNLSSIGPETRAQ